jgi:hypothetical protein
MKQAVWSRKPPEEEGYFWFRTNEINGVVMKVEYYQDPQVGLGRHLQAVPQLPYEWSSKPGFIVKNLIGEWMMV